MPYKDYYTVMGLPRTASVVEIKSAYRALAHQYHPDKSKEPDAEEKFKEMQEAYFVLKNSSKRAAYDHLNSQEEFKFAQAYQQTQKLQITSLALFALFFSLITYVINIHHFHYSILNLLAGQALFVGVYYYLIGIYSLMNVIILHRLYILANLLTTLGFYQLYLTHETNWKLLLPALCSFILAKLLKCRKLNYLGVLWFFAGIAIYFSHFI